MGWDGAVVPFDVAQRGSEICDAISFHVIVEGSGRRDKRTDSAAFQNSRAMDDSTDVGGMGSDRAAVRRGSRLSLTRAQHVNPPPSLPLSLQGCTKRLFPGCVRLVE